MAVWDETLNTGITEIDEQHKELFRRVKGFQLACREGRHIDEITELLDFLRVYVRSHFEAEERYFPYEDVGLSDGHRSHHDDFIEKIDEISARLETEGAGLTLSMNLNHLLMNNLMDHIKQDKVFFAKMLHDYGTRPKFASG